jgi:hypothetical protein
VVDYQLIAQVFENYQNDPQKISHSSNVTPCRVRNSLSIYYFIRYYKMLIPEPCLFHYLRNPFTHHDRIEQNTKEQVPFTRMEKTSREASKGGVVLAHYSY